MKMIYISISYFFNFWNYSSLNITINNFLFPKDHLLSLVKKYFLKINKYIFLKTIILL